MDEYTRESKNWLDKRYEWVNEKNIYIAHEPIYGLRRGHCEHAILFRYMIAYRILRSLSHIRFESLLDVGGGEGYKAALIKNLFNAKVKSCDLSLEACKRAKEIFEVSSETADIHHLPYANRSFDIVLCSETLEHVKEREIALQELLRVARRAVILTLPHESKEIVRQNRKDRLIASHIHHFNRFSFDHLSRDPYEVKKEKIYSSLLTLPCILTEATYGPYYHYREFPRSSKRRLPRKIFKLFLPIFRKIFTDKVAGWILLLDDCLTKVFPSIHYSGMLFLILKESKETIEKSREKIRVDQLLKFSVPYHYLNRSRCQ